MGSGATASRFFAGRQPRRHRESAPARARPAPFRPSRRARQSPAQQGLARIRSSIACSPPKRCVAPVTSSKSPRGGSRRDERREALAPIGDAAEQFQIGRFVRRHRFQRRQHRARIGERLADAQPQRRRLAVERGDDQRVLLLRGDDQRRRCSGEGAPASSPSIAAAAGRSQGAETTAPRSAASRLPEDAIVTIPLHHPMSRSPVAIAHEFGVEPRHAPVFVLFGFERAARIIQRVSALLSIRHRIEAQQKRGDVRFRRCRA